MANEISQENVDKKASNDWLTSGQMFPETEGFLVAIQDQVIPTNNYKRFILKNLQQSDKCRYGCQDSETHTKQQSSSSSTPYNRIVQELGMCDTLCEWMSTRFSINLLFTL
ncbi:unnamed protein product [Acanthoscelides obtectus]|uniref:Uncharacterized protein n=1 Tax=Acanthoscelides obtectus TaxID=200917 RepID=A0A9P0VSX6_ACAOB|nr:unnamed protein product [Acanthoscelides obtectus]CAK1688402.1 hypothetical protein AOBTE_LOCUS36709 [Acanthoscelides obtectus]